MSNNLKYEFDDNRTEKRKTGDRGENIACKFLMKHGYTIVGRNYLKKYGEIDIIAFKDKKYHFVEVKTVSRDLGTVIHETSDTYRPEDNVHMWKLERLGRTIQAYLSTEKLYETDWQIDIITVYLDDVHNKAAVKLIPNIVI